jgi:acetoin utilization deacetylase AcuC-like enzyme
VTSVGAVPVVWSPDCRRHEPQTEVWLGVPLPGTEVPERVDVIRDALLAAGHELIEAVGHGTEPMTRVHSMRLVGHLETVYSDWLAARYPETAGQDRVIPYVFPTAAMHGPIRVHDAVALHGRTGQFCFDTMTAIGPGTWEAVVAASDCAVTAVELVGRGSPCAYALCRPPGHHATADAYGGSCYLNNAAIAAQAFRDRGYERVAVIDVDAHHGNGTEAIFYLRHDVFYGSVHVDPRAGWFPHFVGHADETGAGLGRGANLNVPLQPGSGDTEFLAAVNRLAEAVDSHRASAVVVSLGVDAAADDPESPLQVTGGGYATAGEVLLAELGLPAVVVQEGGYHLPTLGRLVDSFLAAGAT